MGKKKIRLFTLSTCSHCKSAKKFLDDHNVEYSSVDIDLLKGEERGDILTEMMKYNSKRSFPTIVIEEKVIIGFKEEELKRELNIL